MRFNFSEDQLLLQQTVREFLEGEYTVERIRDAWETETGHSPEFWAEFAEIGVPGLLVVKRLRMQGFLVMDFADRDAEAERDLAAWSADGRLKVVEDVIDGLENAPRGLIGLLGGENRGKRIIRVGPDPRP